MAIFVWLSFLAIFGGSFGENVENGNKDFVAGSFILTQKSLNEAPYR